MTVPLDMLASYHRAGQPLSCEIDVQPWICEFWPYAELDQLNSAYEVRTYAPGYFGFATSGGGEMYAFGPRGEVVCLPLIGMSPDVALPVADDWPAFQSMLRAAL